MFELVKNVYYDSVDIYRVTIDKEDLRLLNDAAKAEGFDITPITEDELKYFIKHRYSFESSERNECYVRKVYYDMEEYNLYLTALVGEYIDNIIYHSNYDSDYIDTTGEETFIEEIQ